MKQPSLFENQRLSLEKSIELSIASMNTYGAFYRNWACAYSGGKDSTATVTFLLWAIKAKLIPTPDTFTVLYADTRMELPPLQKSALQLLDVVKSEGFDARIVLPDLDKRFYVYMLGRGVPPPKNTFRWCTPQIKVIPMQQALWDVREKSGEKILMLTGVRLGESAVRDQRISLSCSRNSGECGQGWFQVSTDKQVADTLAPLLHWRLCHVYDWLYFENSRHGYDVSGIAAVYGDEDVRTGCIGCNLASRDNALERLIKIPEWEHLRPLLELKSLYRELIKAKWRKRKLEPEILSDGSYGKNAQRLGPLTMRARAYGLDKILDIQARTMIDLINPDEELRIREMWKQNIWPRKWTREDGDGDMPIDQIVIDHGKKVIQGLLVR